ncbi:hypothetical protein BpHYR1_043696 [Brachionus plicatilis]|uniref:SWIM-type domain-containing protein n=1 Tax=Brachionus plicatilis TaxID=10195 RepID=A0A3M7RNG1_BRAPC|nr:hypothetical protein BpHYR1_043696 [Brachionus plicatilis]
MSSSASILENNFNDTANDAEELPKTKRSQAKAYDFVEDCESLEEFKKLIKNLQFDNVSWNFNGTNQLADCDKQTFDYLKPSAILDMLEKQKFECSSKKQLNNSLANYRRNEHGNNCITMNELVEYFTPRSGIPDDLDQPFIAAYEYDASSIEKRWFRLFITYQFNRDEWELSTCSCKDWLKNYKCDHVIAVCSRLKLCHIKEIAMNIPLERKRRPGRPKATTNALTRQPNETQNVNVLCISVSEKSDSGDPPVQEPISKKIRLEETITVTLQPQVEKKTQETSWIKQTKKIKLNIIFAYI